MRHEELRLLHSESRKALADLLKEARSEIKEIRAHIGALSPLSTLKRGYAVVAKKGKPLLNAKDAEIADELQITLAKGDLTVEVIENAPSKVKRKGRNG